MNEEMHSLLMKIQYKFEDDFYEYFNLTEDDKKAIADITADMMASTTIKYSNAPLQVVYTLTDLMLEAEQNEEYEQADLFKRIIKSYKSKFSLQT